MAMSDDWNRTPEQEQLYDATIATISRTMEIAVLDADQGLVLTIAGRP